MTAKTGRNGEYEFTDVHIGQYQIRSVVSGFKETVTSPFEVSVNARQRVDVALALGSVSDTVTVTSALHLETETSDTGTVISNAEVENLPLDGRQYADPGQFWCREFA